MAIKVDQLYRVNHATFDDYCRDRWGMSKAYSNRLISASEVAKNLTPIGVKNSPSLPATESQARPLTKLPAEEQAEAWKEVVQTAR